MPRLWELTQKEPRLVPRPELEKLAAGSSVLCLSADGALLAAAGPGRRETEPDTLHLWDVARGREISPFAGRWRLDTGHRDVLRRLAFAADGKTLVTASSDKTLRLWDATSGKEIRVLTGHKREISAIALAADGKTLASASEDELRLWDLSLGREPQQLTSREVGMTALAFSPDKKTLISANLGGIIQFWDLAAGKEVRQLRDRPHHFAFANLSSDGTTLIAFGGHRQYDDPTRAVHLWKIGSTLQLAAIKLPVCSAAVLSPDGRLLATSECLSEKAHFSNCHQPSGW